MGKRKEDSLVSSSPSTPATAGADAPDQDLDPVGHRWDQRRVISVHKHGNDVKAAGDIGPGVRGFNDRNLVARWGDCWQSRGCGRFDVKVVVDMPLTRNACCGVS